MKRFFPIFICLCLCISVFAVSASAETIEVDGRTVIDYLDYIDGYDLIFADDGWAFIRVDPSFLGSRAYDALNGERFFERGTQEFTLQCNTADGSEMWCASYYPGASITNTFLTLENIPDGSKFWIQFFCDVEAEEFQTELAVAMHTGIVYYDSNFNVVSHDTEVTNYVIDAENMRLTDICEMTITKPENATYCVFETEIVFTTQRSNNTGYIPIACQFDMPSLKMATSYTHLIINAIINSKKPVGSDGIVDVDELEDYLNESGANGREEAEEVMDEAPDLVLSHLSGFLFMATVIDVLINVGWIRGVLTVSLSLGIFCFITNVASSVGRAFEHRGGKGAGKT